jgi:multidrug efflux system outer membrane protein
MNQRGAQICLLLTAALASRPALGQSESAPTAPTAPTAPEVPPAPAVSDSMLAPVPPARRNIGSWDEAARLLRAQSTDLRRAYDDIRRAEADSRTALAAVLPTLNGTVTGTHTLLPKAGGTTTIVDPTSSTVLPTGGGGRARNTLAGSLRLNVPILDLKAWHSIGTAHLSEDAARRSYEDLERTTAAALASAIAANVTAERVAELGRLGLKNALERLALTEAKERTGTATGLDIVRARQDVAQARGSLVTSDESLRKSRDTLGLALGFAEPIGVTPSTDIGSIETSALKSCRPLPDLEHRPDLAAARTQVGVSERRRNEVDLGFFPTLSAGSTLGETITDANGTGAVTWNIQAILSVPIWDGGARYGARRSAAAVEDQSLAALAALRRSSTVDLAQARRSVLVADESRRVAQESRDLALEVDRMTRAAYQTGKGTSLDLVTSAAALRQAEVNLALQELGVVQARLDSLLTLADCSVAR